MKGSIDIVGRADLGELAGLMRLYCDFYEVAPSDDSLAALIGALLDEPAQGLQLIARGDDGTAVGFATVYWTWSTLSTARIGVMNDLYVIEPRRGEGWADRLIDACAEQCRQRGVKSLSWQTALDNERAQAVYARVGATPERWLDWSLEVTP